MPNNFKKYNFLFRGKNISISTQPLGVTEVARGEKTFQPKATPSRKSDGQSQLGG